MRPVVKFVVWVSALLAGSFPTHANPVFMITYSTAVQNNPQFLTGIEPAVNYVTSLYSSLFSNNVTINFTINQSLGVPLTENFPAPQQNSSFSQIVTALAADGSGAYLPQADPTIGLNIGGWFINTAEAKALGIFAGDPNASDGTMYFNPSQPYTFDPSNQSVPNEYDFVALVEHEFSEMMGRDSNLASGELLPYDLFRFTAPNSPNFSTTQANVYFSINNGATNLANFNSDPSGDIMDWAQNGVANDPYNAFAFPGQGYALNAVDLESMNAVGWESATPEPSAVVPLTLALGLIAVRLRRARASRV